MSWTVRDVMTADVRTVRPDTPLAELNRLFVSEDLRTFPVLEGERLVGIVSRSDIVRQLGVEQSVAESILTYYRDVRYEQDPSQSVEEIGRRVGERLAQMCVRDVMTEKPVTVSPDDALDVAARRLVEKRLHRLPVLDQGRLVGILASKDLVRMIADGRARPA